MKKLSVFIIIFIFAGFFFACVNSKDEPIGPEISASTNVTIDSTIYRFENSAEIDDWSASDSFDSIEYTTEKAAAGSTGSMKIAVSYESKTDNKGTLSILPSPIDLLNKTLSVYFWIPAECCSTNDGDPSYFYFFLNNANWAWRRSIKIAVPQANANKWVKYEWTVTTNDNDYSTRDFDAEDAVYIAKIGIEFWANNLPADSFNGCMYMDNFDY